MSFPDPDGFSSETCSLLARSSLYRELSAEREEILRHKWIESEKAGGDIGFERALVNWVIHHRANWRATRRQSVDALAAVV
jgi:hypothetical protein